MPLAIDGGSPVRTEMLPYGRQTLDSTDLEGIIEVLKEDRFLTTGPRVTEFERLMVEYLGSSVEGVPLHAVAVTSGTAALHCAVGACRLEPGDEVIVPAISFVASANCVLYCGGVPVFCDIDGRTLNLNPDRLERLITSRTKAVVAVDFAGSPCDYQRLREFTRNRGLRLIEDAAHSLGASTVIDGKQFRVGTYADLTTFSFHPVKNITTGEGGMIVTPDPELAVRLRAFRSHGINSDYRDRHRLNTHYYEMDTLGYNYRLCDILCALGISQLKRVDLFVNRRREIAQQYDSAFKELSGFLQPVKSQPMSSHHIYVIALELERLAADRDEVFRALRAEGIGVNVHYLPIHLHPFYRKWLQEHGRDALCPESERAYPRLVTLPLFPSMDEDDVQDVIAAVRKVIAWASKGPQVAVCSGQPKFPIPKDLRGAPGSDPCSSSIGKDLGPKKVCISLRRALREGLDKKN
jgi:perosamine synthetase